MHILLLWIYFAFNICPSLDCWLHNHQFCRLLCWREGFFFLSLWLMLQDGSVFPVCMFVFTWSMGHGRLLQKKENRKEYMPSLSLKVGPQLSQIWGYQPTNWSPILGLLWGDKTVFLWTVFIKLQVGTHYWVVKSIEWITQHFYKIKEIE